MLKNTYGPSLAISEEIDAQKYDKQAKTFTARLSVLLTR